MPKAVDGGKEFCEEIVRGIKEPVKILDCLFAKPEEIWESKFDKDCLWFAQAIPTVKIDLVLASESNFIQQLQDADVLLIRGGKSNVLLERLSKQKDWLHNFKGSVIAGESAGANIFAMYFYALGNKTVKKGLGVLPIKMLVHYGADYDPVIDWQDAEKELENTGEKLELVKLEETKFKVFEV